MNVALVELTGPVGPVGDRRVRRDRVDRDRPRVRRRVRRARSAERAHLRTCAGPATASRSVNGELQAANVAPSTLHWKLAAPPAPVNVKVGVVSLVAPLGPPVIVVSSCFDGERPRGVGGSVKTPSRRAPRTCSCRWPARCSSARQACRRPRRCPAGPARSAGTGSVTPGSVVVNVNEARRAVDRPGRPRGDRHRRRDVELERARVAARPCGRGRSRASVVPAVLQLASGPRSTAGLGGGDRQHVELAALVAQSAAATAFVAPVTSKSHSLSFSTLAPASVTASVPPQFVDAVPTRLRATMLEPICSVPLLTREMPPTPRAPPMLSAIVDAAERREAAGVARR